MKFIQLGIGIVIGFSLSIFFKGEESKPKKQETCEVDAEVDATDETEATIRKNDGPSDNRQVIVKGHAKSNVPSSKTSPVTKEMTKQAKMNQLFEQALNYQNGDDPEAALRAFKQMEQLSPNDEDFLHGYSSFLAENRMWERATPYLEKCIKNNPKSERCHSQLSAYAMSNGTNKEKEVAVRKCLKSTPDNADCRHDLASLRSSQGRHKEAYSEFKKLAEVGSETVNRDFIHYRLAVSAEGMSDMNLALEHYRTACSLRVEEACERLEEIGQ